MEGSLANKSIDSALRQRLDLRSYRCSTKYDPVLRDRSNTKVWGLASYDDDDDDDLFLLPLTLLILRSVVTLSLVSLALSYPV